MKLVVGAHNPWGGPHHPPHKPQCKYLEHDRTGHKGVSKTHFVGGRGSAKTTTGILWLAQVAFKLMVGIPGFWSEPRDADLTKVFLREWERIIPRNLWEYSRSDHIRQIRCKGGTNIDLVSRKVDSGTARVGLGPNYGFGFSDEAAEKFNRRRHVDMQNAIRLMSAPFRFFDTLSTPVCNGYDSWCKREGATVIHSSSYDNPFIPKEVFDDLAADMSPAQYAADIEGKWVLEEGRRWVNFLDDDWPTGNMHPTAEWDDEKPWYLGIDLGQGFGHWQVWQYYKPNDPNTGKLVYPEKVTLPVVVAEGVQHQETFHPVIQRIHDRYTTTYAPVIVASGHDVATRGSTGPAPAEIIRARGWDLWWPKHSDPLYDPRQRANCLDKMILDTAGYRRFCISRKIQRDGPTNETWGVKHAMLNDTFPDPGSGEPFRKDKRQAGISNCEDPRDSTCHLMAYQHPPMWRKASRWAA